MPMTEAELQNNIIELVKYMPTLLYYHTYDSRRSNPGFPDLVIAGPNGVMYRELKSARGKVTDDQFRWLRALELSGQDVAVWRPVDWPDRIHKELERIR